MSVLCLCQLENHLQQSSDADDHIFPLESALAHHLQNMRRIAAAHLHVVARRACVYQSVVTMPLKPHSPRRISVSSSRFWLAHRPLTRL